MRIAFVTGGLEPGQNGVGDYSMALASECRALGHEVRCLGINDRAGQRIETGEMLRLPASQSWPRRIAQAKSWLSAENLDWVSLQFVSYGFHSRGICWNAAAVLRRIVGATPVHLMLHEIWTGADGHSRLKLRLMGMLQRHCILRLFRLLNIKVTHTSNPAYAAILRQYGVGATVLPLFGSVPAAGRESSTAASGTWRFVMFGTLHPVWPPEPLLELLATSGQRVEIWHAGHMGQGAEIWERISREYAGRLGFRRIGPKSPEALAEIFSQADYGIATTPWEIIGKSASVAAMLEHGLPVVVNRDDVHYRGWRETDYDPLLIKMGPDLVGRLRAARRRAPQSRLRPVAIEFLGQLQTLGGGA